MEVRWQEFRKLCQLPNYQQIILAKLEIQIMGFNFSFFGKQEVRKFSYRPRFYDPEAEERRQKYGDFTKPREKSEYVPGSHVKGSFRDGGYRRREDLSRNQKAIGAVTIVLLFAVVYLIYKYFPILIESLTR